MEIVEQHSNEEVYAFALYSDEDGMTVCPSTNTTCHHKKKPADDPESSEYYKFEPAEWKYERVGAAQAFADICTTLREPAFAMGLFILDEGSI